MKCATPGFYSVTEMQHERAYRVERLLGSGAFANVYLAHHPDGGQLAIKKVKKHHNFQSHIKHEIQAGKSLNHPNIIRVREHFEDADHMYIITDYISGCDLFRLIEEGNFKPLGEVHSKKIFLQIVDAVEHCHANGYVHLDIKLDNIMIDRSTLKATLIDFGLCQPIHPERGDEVTKRCGSEEYSCPEMGIGSGSSNPISVSGRKVDAWCLGVVLYAMLSATFPFSNAERKSNNRNLRFHFPISPQAQDLVQKLLRADPAQRIHVEEVKSHPWISCK